MSFDTVYTPLGNAHLAIAIITVSSLKIGIEGLDAEILD
jgi:hypothetical protein